MSVKMLVIIIIFADCMNTPACLLQARWTVQFVYSCFFFLGKLWLSAMSSIMSRKIQTPHIHTVHTVHNYLIKINQLYKAAALQGRTMREMHIGCMSRSCGLHLSECGGRRRGLDGTPSIQCLFNCPHFFCTKDFVGYDQNAMFAQTD